MFSKFGPLFSPPERNEAASFCPEREPVLIEILMSLFRGQGPRERFSETLEEADRWDILLLV